MTSVGRPRIERVSKTCVLCGGDFQVTPAESLKRQFCSKSCSNRNTAASRQVKQMTCPCGTDIPRHTEDGGRTYHYRKFCSDPCRIKWMPRRKPDPANYVTFECETCGSITTKRKRPAHLAPWRFCSNPCAAKHTKKVKHVGIRDCDMVLDSSWECLTYGVLAFLKVPIERMDRSRAIEYAPGHWYAPDFAVGDLAIEVKGTEDDEDPARWAAWRAEVGPLVVLEHHNLNFLRSRDAGEDALRYLASLSKQA